MPKKFAIEVKLNHQAFKRWGMRMDTFGVTWLEHLMVPFGTRKCQFQHVLLYLEE
jgi:hypothetical protein